MPRPAPQSRAVQRNDGPSRARPSINLHAHFSARVPKPCLGLPCRETSCRVPYGPDRPCLAICLALPSQVLRESVRRPFGLHTHVAPRRAVPSLALPSRAPTRHALPGLAGPQTYLIPSPILPVSDHLRTPWPHRASSSRVARTGRTLRYHHRIASTRVPGRVR